MLEIKNLAVSYGKNKVLKDVNLTFKTGMIHGVLGINGAGKTTLFMDLKNQRREVRNFKIESFSTAILVSWKRLAIFIL
jgi:ABC-type multidrug transport system ATPase subunit